MNIKSIKTQDLLKAKTIAPVLFVGIGLQKTYKDYKKAKTEEKRHTLIKDAVILSASALGYGASYAIVKHTPNIKIVDKGVEALSKLFKRESKNSGQKRNIIHRSFNRVEEAIKECLKAGAITLGSISAALGANELVSKYVFKKHKETLLKQQKTAPNDTPNKPAQNPKEETSAVEKGLDGVTHEKKAFEKFIGKTKNNDYLSYINTEFSKDPANKVFASFSFLSVMRVLDFPMTAVAGFDISKEKDMKKRIKRTSYSLISNIFVPTFFVSIASAMVKNQKNKIKIPVLAAATLAGILTGSVAGRISDKKIEENLHL